MVLKISRSTSTRVNFLAIQASPTVKDTRTATKLELIAQSNEMNQNDH